ncbi:MAG TPA: hypothetical protein VLX92_01875 [Kofleriaceae bacterium]|nr:hypothetical protein [Kofleriaceae bacterium]
MRLGLALALALAIAATGCTDDCVSGLCPALGNEQAFAGPCRSAGAQGDTSDSFWERDTCTFTYASGQIATAECDYETDDDGGGDTADWTWSGSAVGSIDHMVAGIDALDERWAFDPTQVVVSDDVIDQNDPVRVYDRATFALLPLVGSDLARPTAQLGLLQDLATTYTWSGQGTTTLVRTGSDGSVVTYTLDALGRIVTVSAADQTDEYTFDGDLLVEHQITSDGLAQSDTTWRYDRGGNVADRTYTTPGQAPLHEVFDYACWK